MESANFCFQSISFLLFGLCDSSLFLITIIRRFLWRHPLIFSKLVDFHPVQRNMADPSGRVVYGVGLWPSACWDRGFESNRGHGCLSLVQCLCCQVEVSAAGWSLVQRSPTDYGVCLSAIKWNQEPRHLLWVGRRGQDYETKQRNMSSWIVYALILKHRNHFVKKPY
jgi:hypothetical protein